MITIIVVTPVVIRGEAPFHLFVIIFRFTSNFIFSKRT